MAKKIGEQIWQTANRIAQQDLNIPLDSKGGFSNPENLLKLKNMNELKTEQTIEKIIELLIACVMLVRRFVCEAVLFY